MQKGGSHKLTKVSTATGGAENTIHALRSPPQLRSSELDGLYARVGMAYFPSAMSHSKRGKLTR